MASLPEIVEFAREAHADQTYGDHPYTYHLEQVSAVLSRFGFEDDVLHCVAWLHDVVEDTDVTLEEVEELAGQQVACIVGRLTDAPGKNRKARAAKTYPRIRECSWAVLVKLADRIANVENCLKSNTSLLSMYRREYPAFQDYLRRDGEYERLWSHLDGLFS